MEYIIKLSSYELAMLDAACRACGLPLAKAIILAADSMCEQKEEAEREVAFSARLSEAVEAQASGSLRLAEGEAEVVSVKFDAI